MDAKNMFCFIGWCGFLLFLVLFFQKCGCPECSTEIKTEQQVTVQKQFDTIIKKIIIKKILPGDSVIVEVPANVDTAAILQRYFNVYYYSQTIADTNLRATINDSVSKNSIIKRSFSYQWLKPTQITTITNTPVELPKDKMALYPGLFAASSTIGDKLGFGIELMLQTKKKTMYGVGYDLLQRRIEAHASMKIHFGK